MQGDLRPIRGGEEEDMAFDAIWHTAVFGSYLFLPFFFAFSIPIFADISQYYFSNPTMASQAGESTMTLQAAQVAQLLNGIPLDQNIASELQTAWMRSG